MTKQLHPWSRYVAVGDSFTEGVGDTEPASPGGNRGWADRVAEVLSLGSDDFAYGNLAVRGKLMHQILAEQVQPALALHPDLVTISAGGNDVLRPGSDPDAIAARFDDAVRLLGSEGATVVVFTGVDVRFSPVLRGLRGKVAIYNENIRAVALARDAIVADMWALTQIQDARMVLDVLAVPNSLEPLVPEPMPGTTWRQARTEDLAWAREYLVPWVLRRVRHQSSGDQILPKRPAADPVTRLDEPDEPEERLG
jgi:lysophospholipase L1-like esterase